MLSFLLALLVIESCVLLDVEARGGVVVLHCTSDQDCSISCQGIGAPKCINTLCKCLPPVAGGKNKSGVNKEFLNN
ncbi:hypothetical protein PHAVU_005G017900g [Olea europaea subsp. europaea]|uniref:Uncharacterized protein n=1 Tax=Olea europaea subsp. europaea TaxID=158383 RepID=A0A8S0R8J6_OLEEU|nr:hypothetical protein PHAVU_005G017900g [Olea europaea subsp. europaea]